MNVRSSPSVPEASLTENSAWAVGVLASAIVPVPVASAIRTPAGRPADGADSVTVNVSSPSSRLSVAAATVNVRDSASPVASASNVRLPLVLSKSDSDAVSSGPTLVA